MDFIKRLRSKFNQGEKKVYENFIALILLQGSNYLIPILILPYLIRVLGAEKFGVIVFAQAFINYLVILTDYGFNFSATREISLNREDVHKVSQIFSQVFITRLFLSGVAFLVLLSILSISPKFGQYTFLYLLAFSIVIGQALHPIWLFQGLEQMKYLTYLNLVAKLTIFILVFLFIKIAEDYVYVLLIYGIASIVTGICSLWIIYTKFKIKLVVIQLKDIAIQLKEGWHFFLSTFSITFYVNLHIIILGFFTNDTIVGYYGMAEKVMMIAKNIGAMFHQATYPHVCKISTEGLSKIKAFFRRAYIPVAVFSFLCGVGMFALADWITWVLSGEWNSEVALLMRWLSFVPFIVILHLPAFQILLAYDYRKDYSNILVYASMVSVLLNILLAYYYGAIGTAITTNIIEILVLIGFYTTLEFKHQKYSLLIKRS